MPIKAINKRFEIVMRKDEYQILHLFCKSFKISKSDFIRIAVSEKMDAVLTEAKKQNEAKEKEKN